MQPEWYMSQILQWIRDNDYFLTIVDKDFIPNGEQSCSLRNEFMRGLVTLMLDKLNFDLGLSSQLPIRYGFNLQLKSTPQDANLSLLSTDTGHKSSEILDTPEHFSHLIDVLLQTEARLSQLNYAFDQPRPSDVLSHPQNLSRWLLLEYKLAYERLNALLENPMSWQIVDETDKRSQCVDDFIAILHAISMRGRQLNERNSRLRFVQIQLKLIRKFFHCLVKQATDANQSNHPPSQTNPSRKISGLGTLLGLLVEGSENKQSSHWISVLNTLKHIHDIMLEWSNDQYYISFWEQSSTRGLLIHGDPWLEHIGLSDKDEESSKVDSNEFVNKPTDSSDDGTGLQGGVFTEVLHLYSQQINKMLHETVAIAVNDLKDKSQNYLHSSDNWLRASSSTRGLRSTNLETSNLVLSADASPMLLTLRNWLFRLSSSMHPKLFTLVWQEIASSLDSLLYNELVLSNRFSILGAAQLRFDLINSVYSLFGFYTKRPESYFAQVRDAVILLNLLPGVAELLKETLTESMEGRTKHNPLAPLIEIGVYMLTPEEALRILALRVCPE